jgi:hypothetical protein
MNFVDLPAGQRLQRGAVGRVGDQAVAPSTHSRPQWGLFLDASIWVSSGPVELSSSLTAIPVAVVNALVMAES